MIKLITAPTEEPITVDEAKSQAVIDHSEDDTMLQILITAARELAESITNRSLAPQTLEVVLDAFPAGKIELRRGPVTAITSVKYLDSDGTEQTLSTSAYDSDTDALVPYVQPVTGGNWPATKSKPGAVRVRYTAGWSRAECPKAIKQWLLVKVASLYNQREAHVEDYGGKTVAEMPRTFADALLDRYTIPESV